MVSLCVFLHNYKYKTFSSFHFLGNRYRVFWLLLATKLPESYLNFLILLLSSLAPTPSRLLTPPGPQNHSSRSLMTPHCRIQGTLSVLIIPDLPTAHTIADYSLQKTLYSTAFLWLSSYLTGHPLLVSLTSSSSSHLPKDAAWARSFVFFCSYTHSLDDVNYPQFSILLIGWWWPSLYPQPRTFFLTPDLYIKLST